MIDPEDCQTESVKTFLETLVLPFPPSVNGYWRSVTNRTRGGKVTTRQILSERAREYRKNTYSLIKKTRGVGAVKHEGALAVMIQLIPPCNRRRDVDNFNKAVFDVMTHAGVWGDDCQVEDLRVIKQKKEAGGMVKVHIYAVLDTPE